MRRIVCWVALIVAIASLTTPVSAAQPRAGYVRVLGVSPTTGRSAWVTVPESIVPYETVEEHSELSFTSAVVGNLGCWTYQRAAITRNSLHIEIWRFTASRHWCGTFGPPYVSEITSVAKMSVQPNIKSVGAVWEYRGLVSTNTNLDGDYYQCCNSSSPRAGNAMWVTGEFRVCVWVPILGTVCIFDKFPHIWINAHYNGNVSTGVNNAGLEH